MEIEFPAMEDEDDIPPRCKKRSRLYDIRDCYDVCHVARTCMIQALAPFHVPVAFIARNLDFFLDVCEQEWISLPTP